MFFMMRMFPSATGRGPPEAKSPPESQDREQELREPILECRDPARLPVLENKQQ